MRRYLDRDLGKEIEAHLDGNLPFAKALDRLAKQDVFPLDADLLGGETVENIIDRHRSEQFVITADQCFKFKNKAVQLLVN